MDINPDMDEKMRNIIFGVKELFMQQGDPQNSPIIDEEKTKALSDERRKECFTEELNFEKARVKSLEETIEFYEQELNARDEEIKAKNAEIRELRARTPRSTDLNGIIEYRKRQVNIDYFMNVAQASNNMWASDIFLKKERLIKNQNLNT